jgi:hypothetical protein
MKVARVGKSLQDSTPAPEGQKVHLVKSKADEIIDVYPQSNFMSNCQPDCTVGGKYKVLAWNMVGCVVLRDELAYTSVDVDFKNKQLHRNIVINDDFGVIMASVGYSGMILASKGAENEDGEEEMDDFIRPDDEDIDMDDPEREEKKRKKHAHIQFKPFNTFKTIKDWHFALKHNEQVECLAIGSGWCAAATDFGYLRVFSVEGV